VVTKGYIEQYEIMLLEQAYPTLTELDSKMIEPINKLMCRIECPCSPKGLQNLNKFDEKLAKDFQDEPYVFTGTISSFYDCYKYLVSQEKIEPIDNKILKNI
jgi:hypothetical protein